MSQFSLAPAEQDWFLKTAVDHYSDGDLPNAERVLRAYLAVMPNDSRGWQLLGSCLCLMGFRQAAEEVYLHTVSLDDDDIYAWAALAEISLDALRWNDAQPYLLKVFSLDPSGQHSAANRCRKILARALS